MKKIIIFFINIFVTGFGLAVLSMAQTITPTELFPRSTYKMKHRLKCAESEYQTQMLRIFHPDLKEWYPIINNFYQQSCVFKNAQPFHDFSTTGVQQQWVRTYESNQLPGYDSAVDVAIDQQDNIYVTGYTTNYPHGMDFCTIKYDKNGNQIWAVYYNGEVNGDDIASAIAYDNDGNIYVGGTSPGIATGDDFVIVKYDSLGQQQWASHYDSPSHSNDNLVDMVIDQFGYIYATGLSVTESGFQISTIKIDSLGVFQWVATYNGPGNRDRGKAIAVDSKGNVYVAGVSKGLNYDNDYVTIKYDANGIQQWAARYHRSGYSQEYAEAIAVDDLENVYVTGGSNEENSSDYVTIKYDKNGEVLWKAMYDGVDDQHDFDQAHDVTVDKQGNVYVTGTNRVATHGTNNNFATIKYNSDGEQQWVAEYDAGDRTSDIANKVIVDDSGYVYVIGWSQPCEDCISDFVTIKYNAKGQRMWLARYDGSGNSHDYPFAIALNSQGEVIVVGYSEGNGSGIDYVTLKYDTQGSQLWESRFNGKNRERGFVNDLTIDPWGNIYVTGGSCNEFVTIKYNRLGEVKWTARLNSEQYGYGAAQYMALDQQGNVYVVGSNRLDISDGNYDFVIVKYSNDGMQQWVSRYDSPPDQWGRYVQDFPDDIEVDRFGNLYVTGHSPGQGSGYDFITIKYGPDGGQQWIERYTSGDDNSDEPIGIYVDNRGGVYVCGNNRGQKPGFTLIKYDVSGEQQWKEVYEGIDTRVSSMTLDGWGNVYLAGYEGDFWVENELIIVKYSPNGERQWLTRYKNADYLIRGSEIKVDELGNVFIAATIFDWNPIFWNFVLLKYNSKGSKLWESPVQSESSYLIANSITLDNEDNIYVGYNRSNDFAIKKYDNQGVEKWTLVYPNPRNLWQLCKAMEVDDEGNIYVASDSRGSNWSVFNTIKFIQTGDDSLIAPVITGYELSQNFPNPFRQQTLIYYKLPKLSQVRIKIYNQLGQQITSEDLGEMPAGKFAYHFYAAHLPGGIYFVQLKANNVVRTRKMVLVH